MNHYKIDKSAKKVINNYFNLDLGGKKVACPYFISKRIERGGLRVMVGKGSPEEIVHEVKVWAKLKGVVLEEMSERQIREFMVERNIGIDCSGFVAHVLDSYLQVLFGKRLSKILKYPDNSLFAKIRRTLRPIENIGADNLTSLLNCIKINDLGKIMPGDLIRAKGPVKNAHHVALITDIYKDDKGNVEKFAYVHSHRYYEKDHGVRKGIVIITDIKKPLKDQEWHDHINGRNYMLEDLLVDYKDNGIRRLRFLA